MTDQNFTNEEIQKLARYLADELAPHIRASFVTKRTEESEVAYDCHGSLFSCGQYYGCEAPHNCRNVYKGNMRTDQQRPTRCQGDYSCDAGGFTCNTGKFYCNGRFGCDNTFHG